MRGRHPAVPRELPEEPRIRREPSRFRQSGEQPGAAAEGGQTYTAADGGQGVRAIHVRAEYRGTPVRGAGRRRGRAQTAHGIPGMASVPVGGPDPLARTRTHLDNRTSVR